jgi:hypothetical protein
VRQAHLVVGIIRLAGQYSPTRMDAAAERALIMGACRMRRDAASALTKSNPVALG